jgi:hypothetical protein
VVERDDRHVIRLGYVAGEPSPMRVEHLRLFAQVEDIETTVRTLQAITDRVNSPLTT